MKISDMTLALILIAAQPSLALAADAADMGSDAEFANTLDSSELDENRGTFSPLVYNISDLTATLNGNSCDSCTSGNNSIDPNAFSGSFLGTVIQNSGHNVVIQSNFIVNADVN